MAGETDLARLRERLEGLLTKIKDTAPGHQLAAMCQRLGMPAPPHGDTKYEMVRASLAAVPDDELVSVAELVLIHLGLDPRARNDIQDLLWGGTAADIPKRARREIAHGLDLDVLVYSPDRFLALLESVWVLDDGSLFSFVDDRDSLRANIRQHVFRNPGDWSTEELFERLGAFDAGHARFALFLEGMTSAEVVPDELTQRRIVELINPHLAKVGAELRETAVEDGYPVFRVMSLRTGSTRIPKNLIFASPVKPDIRFTDALDNDIEIVGQTADQVLVYDRTIGPDGISWRDLQEWWTETHAPPGDADAQRGLHQRLLQSLPDNSPPQQLLFTHHHTIFGPDRPDLPALLPEVWLHWDHKTAAARGRDALLKFRMDFLLLLPRGQRVVIEVDGMHHYADGEYASPRRYADTMRGDRNLKLAGYEVFRFGAHDLSERQAEPLVRSFFTDLYRHFQVRLP